MFSRKKKEEKKDPAEETPAMIPTPQTNRKMRRAGVMSMPYTPEKKSPAQESSSKKKPSSFIEKKPLTEDDYRVSLREITDPLLREKGDHWAWEVEGEDDYGQGVCKRKRKAERAIRKFIAESEYKNRAKIIKQKKLALVREYIESSDPSKVEEVLSFLERETTQFETKELVGDYLLLVASSQNTSWSRTRSLEASAFSKKEVIFARQNLGTETIKEALKEGEKRLKDAVREKQFTGPKRS